MDIDVTSRGAIEQCIQESKLSKNPTQIATGNFLQEIIDNFDLEEYIKIEHLHLDGDVQSIKNRADQRKFFNLPHWIYDKTFITAVMDLHKTSPKKILDLGSGPGHFMLINKFLGHQVHGMDVPNAMYDDVCEFFNLNRTHHIIKAHEPLPKFKEKFDVISAFYANFNTDYFSSDREDRGNNAWGEEEWWYFIRDVKNNLLTEKGYMFMMLNPSDSAVTGLRRNNNSLLPYFKGMGAEILSEDYRIVKISNFSKYQ